MSLHLLFSNLKGSSSSGNFAHSGRPGKIGGSGTGGGHSAIGIDSREEISEKLAKYRKERKKIPVNTNNKKVFSEISHDEMSKLSDIDELCKNDESACKALKYYTGMDGFDEVNKYLRSGEDIRGTIIEDMDRIFTKSKVPKDIVVRRGIEGKKFFNMIQPGKTYQDKAFVSTTIDPKNDISKMTYTLEIRVPKGSSGVYSEKITQFGGERELILNRNSKFNVVSKEGNHAILELINE